MALGVATLKAPENAHERTSDRPVVPSPAPRFSQDHSRPNHRPRGQVRRPVERGEDSKTEGSCIRALGLQLSPLDAPESL